MSSGSAISSTAKLRTYASFVRLEHTLFSLPLILAGIFSVPGPHLTLARWVLTALAAVGARTAAMSLNRLIDAPIDARNPRTQVRELPAGRMRFAEAIALLAAATLVYLLACAALGAWYLKVAVIPLAVFTIYPYLKRFTAFCHVGVGVGLALAPLAGYAAAHPDLADPWPAVALAAFALSWVTGFDIIYATLDEASDRANGIHSMVVWLGRDRALRVSWALHLVSAAALAYAVYRVLGGFVVPGALWLALAGVLFAATLMLLYLEQRWAEDVNLAFFKTNVWVGFLVFAMVIAARLAAGGLL